MAKRTEYEKSVDLATSVLLLHNPELVKAHALKYEEPKHLEEDIRPIAVQAEILWTSIECKNFNDTQKQL